MKILLVTNDFPPRVGGIQVYLENLYARIAAAGHDVTVLAPQHPGDVAYDTGAPFEVVRYPSRIYWPTAALKRRVAGLAAGADVVAFGAYLPMSSIGRSLGAPYVVHTHGFEVAVARLRGPDRWLRRVARGARLCTVVSEYTRRHIQRAVAGGARLEMLKTGVDLEAFHPSVDGDEVRKRHGLGGRPVVACISRLVRRKGQDQILRALPRVARSVPDVAALVVGGGPYRDALQRLAARLGVAGRVVFTGEVPHETLAAHYAAGDVFAMPCRSRLAGLEVEGLGLVYLEAQACARPAIAGDSGGAPEAVVPGVTGLVVGGRDDRALAAALADLLSEPAKASAMGEAGRAFVQEHHHWDRVASRLDALLAEAAR